MFGIELQDVIIALVFFALGFLCGVGSKVELAVIMGKKRRHGKKTK